MGRTVRIVPTGDRIRMIFSFTGLPFGKFDAFYQRLQTILSRTRNDDAGIDTGENWHTLIHRWRLYQIAHSWGRVNQRYSITILFDPLQRSASVPNYERRR